LILRAGVELVKPEVTFRRRGVRNCFSKPGPSVNATEYNDLVERKVFWILFIALGLLADCTLPLWWALVATIPIAIGSWWVAYRSDWF
jgi:hypothetical protein